jgi:peptidoglycan/LPS O-acetylase OafA/YrhL
MFIVIASALVFSTVSVLSYADYFSNSGLYKYLAANITFLNWLHPTLPGVAENLSKEFSAINGSLWTMKVEWALYLSVPIFVYLCSRIKGHERMVAALIIICSIAYRIFFVYLYDITEKPIYEILGRQFFGQLSFFYCGMLIYFCRDWFKKHLLLILVLSVAVGTAIHPFNYVRMTLEPIYITAVVMAFALYANDIKILRHKHNLSYNIYLFHFPVFQMMRCTLPPELPTAELLGIALLVIVALAYIVERYLSIKS